VAVQNITNLKSKFEGGKLLDETDFEDVFDTLFDGTIWSQPLIVQIRGPLVKDLNDPANSLKFQIDCSTTVDFSSFVFRADSADDEADWEVWDGNEFIDMAPGGLLVPAYQNVDAGLVSYTYSGGYRGDVYYIRYRSGFGYIWSDYVVEEVVLG